MDLRIPSVPIAILVSAGAAGAEDKPNTLFLMSDDVGPTNVSAYGGGIVGYQSFRWLE